MQLLGVKIHTLTRSEAIKQLDRPQLIFTPNPEILLEARQNRKFFKALQKGTLMLPDGHGLLLVSTLKAFKSKFLRAVLLFPALILFLFWKAPFKRVFPEIIHGSDFMFCLIEWAHLRKKRVYFLGAGPGIAEKTARFFEEKFPGLKVAGFSSENPSALAFEQVKKSHAEVLFLAYGAPKQELWAVEYADKIPSLFHTMAVGGAFDFWSGTIKRAPQFLRRLGLEWLWRLFLQPQKRLRRIYHATLYFPFISLFFDD